MTIEITGWDPEENKTTYCIEGVGGRCDYAYRQPNEYSGTYTKDRGIALAFNIPYGNTFDTATLIPFKEPLTETGIDITKAPPEWVIIAIIIVLFLLLRR